MKNNDNFLFEETQIIDKWIVTFFAGFGSMKHKIEDLNYSTAVILDTLPGTDILISALHNASLSFNYQKHKSSISWRVNQLQPLLTEEDSNDIPPEVISNFDSLRIDHITEDLHWGLKEIVINKFKKKGIENKDLDAVINIYAVSSWLKGAAIELDIRVNNDFYLPHEFNKIKDPYYKARYLFHLYSVSADQLEHNLQNVEALFDIIREIQSPNKQVRIWELCFSFINNNNLNSILSEIENKIIQIEDKENKSRAYGRMALLLPEGLSKEFFKLSIQAAGFIEDFNRKAQTLQEIHRVLPKDDELIILFNNMVDKFSDPWLKAKAYDRLGEELAVNIPQEIEEIVNNNKELWAPIFLSGIISNKLREFSNDDDIDTLWRKYAENHSNQLFEKILSEGIESNGLVLSLNAAQAVDKMLEGNTVKREFKNNLFQILPLLSNPSIQAKPFLIRWKDNFEPFLAAHAHLLGIESGSLFKEEDVIHILYLLESNNDLSRLKAHLALSSNIWDIGKDRFIQVSKVGNKVIEKIANELHNSKKGEHFKKQALGRYFTNLTHDNVQDLSNWLENESPASTYILQNIESVSDKVFTFFAELFGKDLSLINRKSLLISNCKLAANEKEYVSDLAFFKDWPDDLLFQDIYTKAPIGILADVLKDIFEGECKDEGNLIVVAQEKVRSRIFSIKYLKANEINFSSIGNSFYRQLSGNDQEVIELAELILDNRIKQELLESRIKLIYNWLVTEIISTVPNMAIQEVLIRLLSEISKIAPSSILVRNTDNPILELLISNFDNYSSAWARRGCIVLIGCLGEIDENILDLYLRQSKEDRDIWSSTIEAINQIAFVQSDILDDLLMKLYKELKNESAIRSYFASRILVSLGKNHSTNTKQKRNMLKELTQASDDVLSQRYVYIFRGFGNKNEVISIHKLVGLKTAYDQAIVEIIGLS